jgi:hypothetical protein
VEDAQTSESCTIGVSYGRSLGYAIRTLGRRRRRPLGPGATPVQRSVDALMRILEPAPSSPVMLAVVTVALVEVEREINMSPPARWLSSPTSEFHSSLASVVERLAGISGTAPLIDALVEAACGGEASAPVLVMLREQ